MIFKISLMLAYTFVIEACVTSDDAPFYEQYSVIEKSKIKEPQWIRRQVGTLLVDEFELTSIEYQQDILNLPVGIRSSQKEALDSHKELILNYMLNIILDKAAKNSLDLSKEPDFKKSILEIIESDIESSSKVKDIYYEKVIDKSSEIPLPSYRIYVLVSQPKGNLDELWKLVVQKWSKNRDVSLRKLSDFLKP